MLRHIRMTPTAKEMPRSEGRLLGMVHDWLQPLYRYRIPHTPTPRDRTCTCAYPLFTLRSSRRSLYDEPTLAAAPHETVYVDSTGKSTSPPASEVPELSPAALAAAAAAAAEFSTADVSTTTSCTTAAAAAVAAGRGGGGGGDVDAPASALHSSAQPSAFLSSFGHLPSLRARWAVRRRRGGRLTTTPQSAETCYRCDICDGLQRSAEEAAEAARQRASSTHQTENQVSGSAGATLKAAAHSDSSRGIVERKREGAAYENEEEEEEEGDDAAAAPDGNGSSEERYGYTTSTDIANTAMEDADVAELRHLDPFHVEVFGKPSWGALLKRASREFQAQFARCGLRSRDTSRYAAQATANSEVARLRYRAWVRAEAQRVREEQRRSLQPATPTPDAASSAPDTTPPATILITAAASAPAATTAASPPPPPPPLILPAEQRAMIKYKLDTLHVAGYLARYAVAAYGLPYELNYFTSARELAKLMAEPHSRYVCANSEEQLESMRRMVQGEEPDALLECVASRYSLRIGQPCWSLFLDHAAQRVVLSFRGSLTAADMVIDFMEGYANVVLEQVVEESAKSTTTPPDAAAAAAAAGQRVCTAIPLGFYDSVVEAGSQLLPILRSIHAQYASYTLCVTGHSLGGIEATLFHLLYCGPWRASLHSSSSTLRRGKPLTCPSLAGAAPDSDAASGRANPSHVPFAKTITCAFAAAPVIEKRVVTQVNAWLDAEEAASGSRLISISHGMDLVTRLQLHSLRETFTKAYSNTTPANSSSTDASAEAASPTAAAGQQETKEATVSDTTTVPLLAVPGSMYNVTAGTRRRYLLAIPPSATAVREQIIISAEAVLQHFPCLYLRSLSELLNRYEAKWASLRATATAAEEMGKARTEALTAVDGDEAKQ